MDIGSETILRYVRLRQELRPMDIYLTDSLEPIDPDWVAITHAGTPREGRRDVLEGFCMYVLTDDGQMLAYEQFDTLEIALDQASAFVGIPLNSWRECHVLIPEDHDEYRPIPWSYVA